MSEVNSVEHTFTIELKSKEYVNNISISDHTHDLVLFEGNLGKLIELSLVESDVLEIAGANGILRVTATMEQLEKAIKNSSKAQPQRRGGAL